MLASNGGVTTTSTEATELLSEYQLELKYYRQLVDDQSTELRQLRAKNRDLSQVHLARARVAAAEDDESPDQAATTVTDLAGLPEWAADNQHRIKVLPRFLNSAKKSLYESPATIMAALELLAGPYRNMRQGFNSMDEFSTTLAASGLQLAGSIEKGLAGTQGDSYFVSWGGRRRFLDLHLLKGGGREERYCMRIYFFWDDDTKCVVVGAGPAHLNNSLT